MDLPQEVRLAGRRLLARPGLALAAVVTLALAIGANTAVFSLVRGVLLQPLPYKQPNDLVMIWQPGAASDVTHLSAREWVEYSRSTRSFEQLAAYTATAVNLSDGNEPERVRAAAVTRNVFETLGVQPAQGRVFSAAEDVMGADGVVLVGYELWQRQFGGASDLVGRTIRVSGRPRTVVGIMPSGFRLPFDYREEQPTELWLPAAIDPANAGPFGSRQYFVFGRVRAGVGKAAATDDLHAVGHEWVQLGYVRTENGRLDRAAVPIDDLLTGSVRPALLILFAAVGFILLIACANVTNLLLARSDARRHEVATQAALGATRGRITRELLVESVLLGSVGAALGLAIGYATLRTALALTPVNVLRVRDIGIDLPVLVFSALITLGATLIAGLAPTLDLTRINLAESLAGGGRGGAATVRKRLRYALVSAQTALSVILLIGAGLLARSFVEMRRIDLGFQPDRVLTFRIGLPAASYASAQPAIRFYRDLLGRLGALPGVQQAGAARILPLTNTIGDWTITVEHKALPPESNPNGDWQIVTPGYFEAMGVTLLRGRFITAADDENAPLVALIDQNMANKYWAGENPLGKRFHLGDANQPWITIVGVTQPVHHNAVVEEPRTEMFVPHAQWPRATGMDFAPLGMTVVLKTAADPLAVLPAARAQVRALDAALPVSETRTMTEVATRALAQPRFVALMLGAFAALAITLAAVGMYGVIAFLVARRSREIGIRMALGATQSTVIRHVLGEGLALTGAGVLAGVTGALWLTRFLSAQLYGVQRLDPLTFAVVPVLLLLVGLSATWLPARRAAAASPLHALRKG